MIKKGIDNSLISEELSFIEKEIITTNIELLIARKKKELSTKNYNSIELKTRLYRYLLSKGYSYDEIKGFI